MNYITAALLGAAVLLWAGEVSGQAHTCAPRDGIAARLTSEFHEGQIATAVHERHGETMVIEIWAAAGGSFTILGVNAHGLACLLLAGEAFAVTPVSPPPTESH